MTDPEMMPPVFIHYDQLIVESQRKQDELQQQLATSMASIELLKAENEQLHESDALSGVDVSLSADIVFSQEGHLVGPNDVVHLQITRHESRWICVFRTGIIARVDADLANNYCREPS